MHLTLKTAIWLIVAISFARPSAIVACQINLGRDLNSEEHPPTVIELSSLQEAADKGDPCAQFQLGRLYEIGNRVAKDNTAAWAALYRKAADQNLAEAQNRFLTMATVFQNTNEIRQGGIKKQLTKVTLRRN
jgi:TPR repeat protein